MFNRSQAGRGFEENLLTLNVPQISGELMKEMEGKFHLGFKCLSTYGTTIFEVIEMKEGRPIWGNYKTNISLSNSKLPSVL